MKRLFAPLILVGLLIVSPLTAGQMTNEECLACHADKSLEAETERGKTLDLFVPESALKGSVHEDLSCTDCHRGADSFEDVPHAKKPMKIGCPSCHQDEWDHYSKEDVHGRACAAGDPLAPSCCKCHGGHNILPLTSPDSRMSRRHQSETCGKCHGSEKINKEKGITQRNLITRYKSSVHWAAIEAGKNGAACTDCHGHHNILSPNLENSTVSRENVPHTCEKCHPNEALAYMDGAHGHALVHGNYDVPTCITCHSDHDMASLRTRVGDAKHWASTQVCIWCHGNERMMARYGLDTTPVESYMKDFHGLAQRSSMGQTATCADCHDAHHSLPHSHPASRMNISNRGTACAKCHGKVTKSFARSFSHRAALHDPGKKIEDLIRKIYVVLIILTVFGMLLHNTIIWLWAVREKDREQRARKHVPRMTYGERFSHVVLFLSFTTLAITGFALKFPEVFWARWLFSLGMTEPIRAFIHRTAAVTMTVDLGITTLYFLLYRRGRTVLRGLIPGKRDFLKFIDTMKFHLGFIKERPKYGFFNYAEKFEFWALVWGTLIMMVTGFVLWFPKTMPADWPAWIINVARVIHYMEALLATLAILIWHGYHTLFHPDEYPMNTVWLSGYITREEAEHHYTEEAILEMQPNYSKKLSEEKSDEKKW